MSFSRPGYGASTRVEGRSIADCAGDAERVADALGVERFAVMGHSGGAPHALACAALLPERVSSAVAMAGLAPRVARGLAWDGADWFAGMYPGGAAELRAAGQGAKSLGELLAEAEWDPEMFTAADFTALDGDWAWFNRVVELANQGGPGGMIDDDIAYVNDWGFDPTSIAVPTLLVHGRQDRVVPARHSEWLAEHLPDSEMWPEPDYSHISVLKRAEDALDWIAERRWHPAAH